MKGKKENFNWKTNGRNLEGSFIKFIFMCISVICCSYHRLAFNDLPLVTHY